MEPVWHHRAKNSAYSNFGWARHLPCPQLSTHVPQTLNTDAVQKSFEYFGITRMP